jgi:hypothetical protein
MLASRMFRDRLKPYVGGITLTLQKNLAGMGREPLSGGLCSPSPKDAQYDFSCSMLRAATNSE